MACKLLFVVDFARLDEVVSLNAAMQGHSFMMHLGRGAC